MVNRDIKESQDCCLIKLFEHIEDECEDRFLTSFYVKNYTEFVKFFHFCKENQIFFYVNEFGDVIEEKYLKRYGTEFFGAELSIKDIWITLPTEESMLCINVVF